MCFCIEEFRFKWLRDAVFLTQIFTKSQRRTRVVAKLLPQQVGVSNRCLIVSEDKQMRRIRRLNGSVTRDVTAENSHFCTKTCGEGVWMVYEGPQGAILGKNVILEVAKDYAGFRAKD